MAAAIISFDAANAAVGPDVLNRDIPMKMTAHSIDTLLAVFISLPP
jgi:hypothetical protein